MGSQTIIITGASDGIGAAAARELKARGEQVVIVGRSRDKTRAIADELDVPFHLADYADLAQVRELATELDRAYPRIDVLANNAGGIMGERTLTRDGFEKTFQVNHLAGFLLTHLLMPKLIASRASVIQTASVAARMFSRFDIDDLQNERRYSSQTAYGNGKLANILFTKELHRRYASQGIAAAAFHPGVVATGFGNESTAVMRLLYHTPIISRLVMTSPKQGAGQLFWLAQSKPGSDWQPGNYFEKRKVARSAPAASDDGLARALWERSAQLLHLDA